MYSLGVEIYCAPTADGRETWASTIRHIAAEGRCFVISVNQFARKSDYPEDYPPFRGVYPSITNMTHVGEKLAGSLSFHAISCDWLVHDHPRDNLRLNTPYMPTL